MILAIISGTDSTVTNSTISASSTSSVPSRPPANVLSSRRTVFLSVASDSNTKRLLVTKANATAQTHEITLASI